MRYVIQGNVRRGKCPFGEISFRGNFFWGTVHRGNVRSGSYPFGELPFGKLSVGQMSIGERSIGEMFVGELSYKQTKVQNSRVYEKFFTVYLKKYLFPILPQTSFGTFSNYLWQTLGPSMRKTETIKYVLNDKSHKKHFQLSRLEGL